MNDLLGIWSMPGQTQTAGTAIALGIPPHTGSPGSAPFLYARQNNAPNWTRGIGMTRIMYAAITSAGTAHTWYILRPKNYTTIAEIVAKNDTTVVMADNPGLYATTYKYPLPSGLTAPGNVADNTPASGDYVMFQLDNGTWHFSLVSSLATLTLTIATGTPNVDGSTAAVGRILFFFGAGGDVDPATGKTDPTLQPAVSATTTLGNGFTPLAAGLRPGDPLVVVNANAAAASTLASLAGDYSRP